MNDRQPDSELISRACQGDRGAFAMLCERHKTRLWRVMAGAARGADAEDLAQEAMIRAWCAIDSCRNAASFEAWLCRIAVNVAYDYHRSAWKRRVVFTGDAQPDSATGEDLLSAAERRETARRLRRAVAALPHRQCLPIWMHYFEQFTVSEIAELEGIAESTVRSRMQVGLRRLRHALDDLVVDRDMIAEPIRVAKGLQI